MSFINFREPYHLRDPATGWSESSSENDSDIESVRSERTNRRYASDEEDDRTDLDEEAIPETHRPHRIRFEDITSFNSGLPFNMQDSEVESEGSDTFTPDIESPLSTPPRWTFGPAGTDVQIEEDAVLEDPTTLEDACRYWFNRALQIRAQNEGVGGLYDISIQFLANWRVHTIYRVGFLILGTYPYGSESFARNLRFLDEAEGLLGQLGDYRLPSMEDVHEWYWQEHINSVRFWFRQQIAIRRLKAAAEFKTRSRRRLRLLTERRMVVEHQAELRDMQERLKQVQAEFRERYARLKEDQVNLMVKEARLEAQARSADTEEEWMRTEEKWSTNQEEQRTNEVERLRIKQQQEEVRNERTRMTEIQAELREMWLELRQELRAIERVEDTYWSMV